MAVDVCITRAGRRRSSAMDLVVPPPSLRGTRRLVHAASCHRAAFGGHRLRRQVCGKNVGHLPPLTSAPDLTLTLNHNA